MSDRPNIPCPFCHDDDYDLVGLKAHLLRDCVVFSETESPEEERIRLYCCKTCGLSPNNTVHHNVNQFGYHDYDEA